MGENRNPEGTNPNISVALSLGFSVHNQIVDVTKISDNPHLNESEPAILFIGGHHGDEVVSVAMANHLIDFLVTNYETRADIRQLVNEREIWVIPCLNPDGYERTLQGTPWRKNMRDNGDGSFGVDLNRNYGHMWGTDSHTSDDPSSDTYHGPEPFSEPETQALKELVESINFTASVSFHSSGELILYPWGHTDQSTERHELQKEIASDMAAMNGYTAQQASEQYVAHGDCEDWLFSRGVMSFTFELGIEDNPADPLPVLEQNIAPCLYLIDIADDLEQAFLPQWTCMYYMAGDNSLSPEIEEDLNQMKSIGGTGEMNVLALADGAGDSDSRAYVVRTGNLQEVSLEGIDPEWDRELRMDRQATLGSFLNWTKKNYPARHYLLEIWGHSSSWKYAGYDDSTSQRLTAEEIAGALEGSGLSVDIVSFDSCAMASMEVAAALSQNAMFMLASEKDVPKDGFPYQDILRFPADSPFCMPYEFASAIPELVIDSYADGRMKAGSLSVSLSLLDLTAFPGVLESMEQLSLKYSNKLSLYRPEIKRALKASYRYEQEDYGDLGDFLALTEQFVQAPDLDKRIRELQDRLDMAILSCWTWDNPKSGGTPASMSGLSLYLPRESAQFDWQYNDTFFCLETGWHRVLGDFHYGREHDLHLRAAGIDMGNQSMRLEFSGKNLSGLDISLEVGNTKGEQQLISWDNCSSQSGVMDTPFSLELGGSLDIWLVVRFQGREEDSFYWERFRDRDLIVTGILVNNSSRPACESPGAHDLTVLVERVNINASDNCQVTIGIDERVYIEDLHFNQTSSTASVSLSHTFQAAGARQLSIIVDPDNKISETNLSNNYHTTTLFVGIPDFKVSSLLTEKTLELAIESQYVSNQTLMITVTGPVGEIYNTTLELKTDEKRYVIVELENTTGESLVVSLDNGIVSKQHKIEDTVSTSIREKYESVFFPIFLLLLSVVALRKLNTGTKGKKR